MAAAFRAERQRQRFLLIKLALADGADHQIHLKKIVGKTPAVILVTRHKFCDKWSTIPGFQPDPSDEAPLSGFGVVFFSAFGFLLSLPFLSEELSLEVVSALRSASALFL